jgi:hypothetical protein
MAKSTGARPYKKRIDFMNVVILSDNLSRERLMSVLGQAVLFSEMTPPPEAEAQFNDWYDSEHIPLRMNVNGFRSAQRYRNGQTQEYLAVYEFDAPQVLGSADYAVVKNKPSDRTRTMLGTVTGFTRYIGGAITSVPSDGIAFVDAPVLYAVFFNVPVDRLGDFDAWYGEDHVPLLLEDKRWLGVRRFAISDSEPGRFTRLALHYLADRAVLESDARQRARQTPWRARLASEPWFKGHYVMFDRLGERFIGRGKS